ncbi:MAG: DoxX family protein [Candidatus Woesearchaeota archaeon]
MKEFAPFALRICIGGIFVFAGIMKLFSPSMVVGALDSMGFPGPVFWAWLLIAVEILCGVSVILGFKVRWATIPLAIVMLVVITTTDQFMTGIAILAGLVSLWLSGAGKWALSRD